MPQPFQPVAKRARYNRSGFTGESMLAIAEAVRASILNRIHAGMDVNDAPAPPLKEPKSGKGGYRRYKARVSPPAIRNWWFTGFTLRCLKVLEYSSNHAVIGFLRLARPGQKNPLTAAQIASLQNRRSRQFGMSPHDKQVLIAAVRGEFDQYRGQIVVIPKAS